MAGLALAATPALASAAPSTCKYDPTTKTVTLTDLAGSGVPVSVVRENNLISFNDPNLGFTGPCARDSSMLASVFNTDKIVMNGTSGPEHFVIDLTGRKFAPGATPDPDGSSEIEVRVNADPGDTVEILGTVAPQTMQIGHFNGIQVRHTNTLNPGFDLGADIGTDFSIGDTVEPRRLIVHGGPFADHITGRGGPGGRIEVGSSITMIPPLFPTLTSLQLFGGADNDELVGGDAIRDTLKGEDGNDTLRSNDGTVPDVVDGGPGIDTAVFDAGDSIFDAETKVSVSVGRLHLSRRVLDARAGSPAKLTLKWIAPRRWRDVRTIQLDVARQDKRIGSVSMKPAVRRLHARGQLRLSAGSRLTHRGKTVTARLGLRLPKALSGQQLEIGVWAINAKGRKQTEPHAGMIRVR